MTFTLLRQGRLIPVPPPDKARALPRAAGRSAARPAGRRAIVGTPGDGARGPRGARRATTAPRRSIVVTITHDHEARRRSYELIAEAFGLAGAADPSPSPPERPPPRRGAGAHAGPRATVRARGRRPRRHDRRGRRRGRRARAGRLRPCAPGHRPARRRPGPGLADPSQPVERGPSSRAGSTSPACATSASSARAWPPPARRCPTGRGCSRTGRPTSRSPRPASTPASSTTSPAARPSSCGSSTSTPCSPAAPRSRRRAWTGPALRPALGGRLRRRRAADGRAAR